MDYLNTLFSKIKEVGLDYRRRSYYYFGYIHHEIRLAQYGGPPSKKYEAVRTNDFEEIEKNRYPIDLCSRPLLSRSGCISSFTNIKHYCF